MKIDIKAKITGKRIPHPFGEVVPRGEDSMLGGFDPFPKNDKISFNNIKGEAIFERDGSVSLFFGEGNSPFRFEIHVTPEEQSKSSVFFSYFGLGIRFSSFFSEKKECQFSLTKYSFFDAEVHTGIIQALKIKNGLTKNGGKLTLRFNTFFGGVLTNASIFELSIIPSGRFLLS
ncbi:MAG: hypothetical protein E7614_03880 [Ruminococcaceae bacterium]|nr:hypothetical protein [Oscillospiraceae bacterium]